MFGFVKRKVRVFISSISEDRYAIARKAIRSMLEETNLCEVYAFEDEGGKTEAVIPSYLNRINEIDVLIVLIDNKDGVSDHVQREITRARELKKKCFFFFCDEYEKQSTQLQEDLKTNGVQFCPIHEFSDFPEKVYHSVIQEIIDIYREYCNEDELNLKMTTIQSSSLTVQADLEEHSISESDNAEKSIYIQKKIFDDFPITYNVLLNEMGFSEIPVETPQKDDEMLSCLLKILLLEEDISDDCLEEYKEWVLSKHSGRLKDAIKRRLDVFTEFIKGNIDNALENMKEAFLYVQKFQTIPNWIKDDIALDYRNLQNLYLSSKGMNMRTLEGQDYLDKTEKMIIYPNIDRFASEVYKSSIRKKINETLELPYAIRTKSPRNEIKKISNMFIIAAQNVSISYMCFISDYLLDLCMQETYDAINHNQLLYIIKRLLEIGNEKKLKEYDSMNDISTGRIDSEDVKAILISIGRMPIEYERINSQLLLFQFFSYYMDDITFTSFYNIIKEVVDHNIKNVIIVQRMSKVLKECQYRVNAEEICYFIQKVIEEQIPDQYDLIFSLLESLNILSKLQIDERKQIVLFLVHSLNNTTDMSSSFMKALVNVRVSFGDQAKELDEVVKERNKDFYDREYSLSVFPHLVGKDCEYIEKLIDGIEHDNSEKSIKGIIMSGHRRYYCDIWKIIAHENLVLPEDVYNRLVSMIFQTLHAEEQLYIDKIDAVLLLQLLQVMHSTYKTISGEIIKLDKDIDIFIGLEKQSNNVYNRELLIVEWQILLGLIGLTDEADKADMITKILHLSVPGQMKCLDGIRRIAMVYNNNWSKNKCFEMLWIILLILEKRSRTGISIRIAFIHAYLVVTGSLYKDQSLNRLSIIMDNCGYKTKAMILELLAGLQGKNATIDAIFQKGRVDNHYVIRKLANGEKIK